MDKKADETLLLSARHSQMEVFHKTGAEILSGILLQLHGTDGILEYSILELWNRTEFFFLANQKINFYIQLKCNL